jgi:hypothetical protein
VSGEERAAAPGLAHPEALAPAARAALPLLAGRSWAGDAYLAGSAALALHLGHRPVRDLDLMTGTNRLAGPERRDLLADLVALDPGCRVETARDGYLFARLASGVGLKLFHYPYPLVDPVEELDGLAVAAAVDLGLMKLAAIISRGARRDFLDLHLLCRRLPLADLLARAPEKFGHVGDFALQALKALADRSECAGEPPPRLAEPVAWEEVERWADEEVRRLGRAHVGLEA